ncbi:rho GTPase-activating 5-like [Olea europaea subsp. europaea]|uniref:Rho GTPase-activating 5-like n=1 Tax=Olea europaea subsp. europaea TaxID=158383 RepID=A0A8S0RIA4_OLEEU|nr:rho GTPase-activating 5-like [Olea europaea subsp. europaea]
MTEVLHSSSSSSPSISTPTHNARLFHQTQSYADDEGVSDVTAGDIEEEEEISVKEKREKDRRYQLSLLALLVTLFRKSFWLACKTDREEFSGAGIADCGRGVMEIGWPTDVQHVNHVTFDRFDGFLGLPVEFEPEVPRRAPSASATVFGVSTESMQLSYDPRGNSVPTILLLLQRRLYAQGGLQAEGIFRITAGNSQEEYVRDQLNSGVVSEGIDVHCLAGLIKAWFRELPRGVLDSLSPEEVMQCQSEEDCDALVRILPSTEAALLDWAINLMVDVVQQEHLNKMNARNIAMVFAPNMTQMADPLTALMYAVQVMNFLKTLIEKTLREREDSLVETAPISHMEPSDDNGHQDSSQLYLDDPVESNEDREETFIAEDPNSDVSSDLNQVDNLTNEEYLNYSTYTAESDASVSPAQVYDFSNGGEAKVMNALQTLLEENCERTNTGQSSASNPTKTEGKVNRQQVVGMAMESDNKIKGISNLSRINSITERI